MLIFFSCGGWGSYKEWKKNGFKEEEEEEEEEEKEEEEEDIPIVAFKGFPNIYGLVWRCHQSCCCAMVCRPLSSSVHENKSFLGNRQAPITDINTDYIAVIYLYS